MADDVGGIRGEVTADISPLRAALDQAAAEYRRFDQQYGRLVIHVSAQVPNQQALEQTHRQITQQVARLGAVPVPIQLIPPSNEDIQRVARTSPTAVSPTARAAAAPAPTVIERPAVAPPPTAAEPSAKSDAMRTAEAQVRANQTGRVIQYTTASGGIARVSPNTGGGAVGGGGGYSIGGEQIGPRGFFGGRETDIPGMQEELGQLRRQNEELRRLVPGIGSGSSGNEANYQRNLQQEGRRRIDLMNEARNAPNLGRSYKADYRVSRAQHTEFDRLSEEEATAREKHTGLARELFDSAIARGATPDQADAEVASFMAADAAAGGAGGGGGGRRRRTVPPPPPPEEPAGGLSAAQIEQRRAAGRASYAKAVAEGRIDPETGAILSIEEATRRATVGTGVLINPTPEQRAAQIAARVNLPETPRVQGPLPRPAVSPAARAAESRSFEELGLPAPAFPTDPAEQQWILMASQGLVGTPAQQQRARELVERTGGTPPKNARAAAFGRTPAPPRLTQEQRVEVATRNPELAEGLQFAQQARELGVQAQAGVQQRSLGTFITGLVQAGAGRPASVIAIREQAKATADYEKALDGTARAQKAVENSQDALAAAHKNGAGNLTQLTENYQKYLGQLDEAEKHQAATRQRVVETSKALDEGSSAIRGLTAGFVGGIAGSLAYGVGITAVTGALDLASKAADRGLNLFTGYIGVTQRITGALSDQAREQHGLTNLVVAQQFAQSGLASSVGDTIRPLIEERVAIEAGSKAMSDQIDLLHTFQNLQAAQRQGRFPGISEGTGGFFGTPLFAQPGILEQLSGLTAGGQRRERTIAGGAIGTGIGAVLGGAAGALVGGPAGLIPGIAIGAGIGAGVGAETGAQGGRLTPFGLDIGAAGEALGGGFGLKGPSGTDLQNRAFGFVGLTPPPGQQAASAPSVALALATEQMNEAASRATPNMRGLTTAIIDTSDAAEGARNRTSEQLRAAFPTFPQDQIDHLREAGLVLQGVVGTDLKTQAIAVQDFYKAVAQGSALPSSQEALARLREQTIPARLLGAQLQTGLALQAAQIQAGVAAAAAPPLPFGTTIPGGVGALSNRAAALTGGTPELQALQVGRIEATRVEISQITAPLGQSFQQGALGAFDRLQGLGQQAAGLQSFIIQQQVGLQTAQFDEQIRLANLQASDLAATLNTIHGTSNAITSSSYDNLGAYQGQLILLQRQSAQLQLENQQLGLNTDELSQQLAVLQLQLQQRQLNFRIALAGFATPGQTPQEIAARTREAEIEANFAQRQLNIRREILRNQREILANNRQQVGIQEQALPLQFKIQDITLQRDYVTARNALGLLTRARQVNINVAGATEALSAVNNEIAVARDELQAYVQQATEFQSSLIGDMVQYVGTFSSGTGKLLNAAQDFFAGIGTAYADSINDYLTGVTNSTLRQIDRLSSGGYIDPNTGGYRAPGTGGFQERAGQQGFLGMTMGPTRFLAGEVQGEAVAILKNPREMTMNGSGGGGTQIVFNIVINNPNVNKSEDMDTLARVIAAKVEERISRRGTLLGMRP